MSKRAFQNDEEINPGEASSSHQHQDKNQNILIRKKRGIIKKLTNGEGCKHTIVIKDLCAECGKDLRNFSGCPNESSARVSMIHHVPELIVTSELANELGDRDKANLLRNRKLILLCDLDQTLVHTSDRPPKPEEDSAEIERYMINRTQFYTKIRPHAKDFIESLSKLYELSVVTYGHRIYAHAIARILDPNSLYFGHRILSRNELLSEKYKSRNIKSIFPRSDELIVIIDDRTDVWMHLDSLIHVKPYTYFTQVGDINAPPQIPTMEPRVENAATNNDGVSFEMVESDDVSTVADTDNVLEHLERILSNIHEHFYQYYEKNNKIRPVKDIINHLRSKVLAGEHIVLSGIIPREIDPKKCTFHRICRQFGAEIDEKLSVRTSVLIAARPGTEKVRVAKKLGIPVVSTRWLCSCIERWQKVEKKDFLLECDFYEPKPSQSFLQSYVESCEGEPTLKLDAISNMETFSKTTLNEMMNEVDEALSGESDDDTNDDTGSFSITPQHNISLVDDGLENSHSSKECFGKNEDQEGEVITSK